MGEIKQKGEQKIKYNRKIIIPRRQPSIVIPERVPIYVTPDKTTCIECGCFPNDPYVKNKKLLPCLKSPLTLYELSAKVVDDLHFPDAFTWTAENVADWISDIGLPQYRECILVNDINGLRLLMLEDPSKLPLMNIRDFEHIKIITSKVRQLYSTEFIRFARSIGLPPRKPLTHCTWFKSRTGPSWGIRKNWTRCDILRWMKIIMPEPIYLDHWDLVWYQKPDFPKVKFGRVHIPRRITYIPHYIPKSEKTTERLVKRKFRLLTGLSESQQKIWVEDTTPKVKKTKKVQIKTFQVSDSLLPKKINLAGLTGRNLILARRKLPKTKFMP
ncbi:PREDICTED: uncharacterized protein LOC106114664 [Papilio xuthus]|uniref:Uncharacterized protein LOC106114664 n=1 Tax=Papilio xuthus TaxID=66420 RepID=A0AAJ7E5E7_PAPXU|nr:PREDICTED: uncharacterized protein LOC106114664 [Papilio xuthus]